MKRGLTPARDFMESRGWSWGPWSPILRVPLGVRPKVSETEQRARRLAALAWHAVQQRDWYKRNRNRALATRARYRERRGADNASSASAAP